MLDFTPKNIEKIEDDALRITWEDGHVSVYSFTQLRCSCPCAMCKDEWSGETLLDPATVPEDLKASRADLVGNYALSFSFSDGHGTGIYSFENLRKMCRCTECSYHPGSETNLEETMERAWDTIIEPFRIKSVEPLGFTTAAERREVLKDAAYNVFGIPADKVLIDLLTDSGTSAMSAEQWAAVMRGDESYAGARSFFTLEKTVRALTGYRHVLPVHQGRAAERILMGVAGGPGKTFLSNSHFDTTRANVEATGASAVDLPVASAWDFASPGPFKGDMDVAALKAKIAALGAENVPMIVMTLTNNSLGGQPVSMKNLREVAAVAKRHKIPVILDVARFAENAYFIKKREPGYGAKAVEEIAREMFSHGSGCMMSAKKDALVNIGGFLALNDPAWAARAREALILGEGFPTYGGLAGRDLEAMARGLVEILDEHYLAYRIRSIEYLGDGLRKAGVPIVEPPGGHAVYVDAKRFLPHIPPERYPGQALVCELYLTAGIRAVEIGSLMFGKSHGGRFTAARMELVRLAIPRRVYTQSHIDFVIEVFADLAARKRAIRGLRVVESAPTLSHFTAKLSPVPA